MCAKTNCPMEGVNGLKHIVLIAILLLLAGCGVDGAPFLPNGQIGINAGSNGVSTDCSVGGTNGVITISAGC